VGGFVAAFGAGVGISIFERGTTVFVSGVGGTVFVCELELAALTFGVGTTASVLGTEKSSVCARRIETGTEKRKAVRAQTHKIRLRYNKEHPPVIGAADSNTGTQASQLKRHQEGGVETSLAGLVRIFPFKSRTTSWTL
jgi:hypothetical protein